MTTFRCVGFIKPCKECTNHIPVEDNFQGDVRCEICNTLYEVLAEGGMVLTMSIKREG